MPSFPASSRPAWCWWTRLNVDMDAHTNVESMQLSFDNETGVQPILWLHNKPTKIPIPIPVPDISLLKPPLGPSPSGERIFRGRNTSVAAQQAVGCDPCQGQGVK